MKKDTGGYVLIYVLVVFILLGLACTAISTFALNGLKTQRAALETDRQRYAAEGIVEQTVASLLDSENGVATLTGEGYASEVDAQNALEADYQDFITAVATDVDGLAHVGTRVTWGEDSKNCTFETEITAEQETQRINATLQVVLSSTVTPYSVEVGEPDPETGEQPKETKYQYSVTSANLSYADYQVVTIEPEGGDEP